MFTSLLALGITSGAIHRIALPSGKVDLLTSKAGAFPDGIVVRDGEVFWTTMGMPTVREGAVGEAALDYSARTGGVHALSLESGQLREVTAPGVLTTGKQLADDGAGRLYWGDREGCRISSVRMDGTDFQDLVINTPDEAGLAQCVGVAVDPEAGYLYWTQKGPAKGGQGRIFRAGLTIPDGQSAQNRDDIEVLWDSLPEPIDLEIHDGWLYWTDRGAEPLGNTLNRAPIPAPGAQGTAPQILAEGFKEAIGLALDAEAGLVYVADLNGSLWEAAIPKDGQATPARPRRLADLGAPLSGIAGLSTTTTPISRSQS
ncbi:hypothetical protein [Psychromicrobium xiongbiense]|uniref:hypothetical protein n=1 Tax=Psychromicrobium xiongbiense TaxID=3051184 RepID=UPI00255739C4|nr:hypothetical protein [Psychromicrobium sp. YIM S02556]